MLSIRFTTLLLLALILFLHFKDSMSTQAQAIAKEQGNEVNELEEGGITRNMIPINKIKEIHEAVYFGPKKLRVAMVSLRKMMLFKEEYSSATVTANDLDEEKGSKFSKTITSVAASYVGKGNINVKRKKSSTGTTKHGRFNHDDQYYSRRDDHDHVKFIGTTVIAFNADYHIPRPHPPKNN